MRRDLIEAYAARAIERERAQEALRVAQQALESASFEATQDDSGDVSLPAAVTVNDQVVLVSVVRDDGNYYLEHTIAERL